MSNPGLGGIGPGSTRGMKKTLGGAPPLIAPQHALLTEPVSVQITAKHSELMFTLGEPVQPPAVT